MHSKNTSPDLDLDLLGELRDVMGDDFAILVASWRRDADMRLAGMKTALGENDAIELRHLAHSLKGSSANLGARNVASLCQEVEFLAADRRLAGMQQRLDVLGEEVDQASRALNQFLNG